MEIHGLVVLHCTEGSSDKVWGWFLDENRKVIKYWGKRTANKFSVMPSNLSEVASDKVKKLKKKYIPLNSVENRTSREVRKTLHKQYGIAPPITNTSQTLKEKSKVTGKEMEQPIRHSDVHRTLESNNMIVFYNKKEEPLGTRPATMRDTIFQHIRKTREEVKTTSAESLWVPRKI
jgi:hypothetical protein